MGNKVFKIYLYIMKTIHIILIFSFLINILEISGQSKEDRMKLGFEYAKKELRQTLIDSKLHNVVDNKRIIVKDTLTAISIVEPILFGIYGKESIVLQQPYEIFHIDNYWVVIGTLDNSWQGGVFLAILDDRNCEFIRITHGQ